MHPEPDLGSRSDEELLVASGRDTEAFGLLYDRTIGDVLAWFARRTADGHVAADLAAETFAAAFVSRRRFAPRGDGTARAWLFGVARHQLGRYARRERVSQKYRRRLGMPLTAVDDTAAERIEARADLEAMRHELVLALAELPEGQREAVRLRIVDELPYAQVAARLGCSEGAARVRVTRGLAQLAEVLGP